MNEFRYRYHGLRVASELEMAEWLAFRDAFEGSPDVSIRVSLSLCDNKAEGRFRIEAAGVGSFLVRGGREIEVCPLQGAAARVVRQYVMGSAWAVLLFQRGAFVLHASAVQSKHGAFVFCGERGSGKSTMAALLRARGYSLLTDDMCCVSGAPGSGFRIWPSTPRIKLWDDSAREAGLAPDETLRGIRIPKVHYDIKHPMPFDPVEVRGLFFLSWGESDIRRVSQRECLRSLLSFGSWRADLLLQAGDPALFSEQSADFARSIPAWEFRRPRRLAEAGTTSDFLVNHLEKGVPFP